MGNDLSYCLCTLDASSLHGFGWKNRRLPCLRSMLFRSFLLWIQLGLYLETQDRRQRLYFKAIFVWIHFWSRYRNDPEDERQIVDCCNFRVFCQSTHTSIWPLGHLLCLALLAHLSLYKHDLRQE